MEFLKSFKTFHNQELIILIIVGHKMTIQGTGAKFLAEAEGSYSEKIMKVIMNLLLKCVPRLFPVYDDYAVDIVTNYLKTIKLLNHSNQKGPNSHRTLL